MREGYSFAEMGGVQEYLFFFLTYQDSFKLSQQPDTTLTIWWKLYNSTELCLSNSLCCQVLWGWLKGDTALFHRTAMPVTDGNISCLVS